MRISAWVLALVLAVIPAGAATVELVSKAETAADSFGVNLQPALSADGRYVVFISTAPNLAPGQEDDNRAYDIFLHDRLLGTTTLVSHAAGSPARAAGLGTFDSVEISADGRYVAFSGGGMDLVPGATGTNRFGNVYLWDRVTGTTTLVSHAAGLPGTAADGGSYGVHLSADGNFLVFSSDSSNLVAGQAEPNGPTADVFLWSRASDTTTLVSRRDGTTATAANQSSLTTAISADGGAVVFTTRATDLLQTVIDVNEEPDVYAYQRSTGTLSLVSRAASALQGAAGASPDFAAVSADGRYVAFASASDQLVPAQVDDGAVNYDAFLYDRMTGEMRLASHASTSARHARGIFDASVIAMSADGRYVAFSSQATDLVPGQTDTNGGLDVFVFDRVTGLIALASHSRDSATTAGAGTFSSAGRPSLSADGRFVVFNSYATDLVPGQADASNTIDVFLYDQASGSVTLVSHTRASASTPGNGQSFSRALSADGGVAAFLSYATDLGEGQADPYLFLDLFLYERTTGEITSASRRDPSLTPPLTSLYSSILGGLSADGRSMAFLQLTRGIAALRDTVAGTTTRLSPPVSPKKVSLDVVLSADGRVAAFLLGQVIGGSAEELYLYDRTAGVYALVNHALDMPTQPEGSPSSVALSADGRYVAYQCSACGLVAGHPGPGPFGSGFQEVFLYDRVTGANTLVSHAAGSPTARAGDYSYAPAISADGRYVVFWSFARDLVPGQIGTFFSADLFVFDRMTGSTELVTHVPGFPTMSAGASGASRVSRAAVSADGRFIAFESALSTLVPGQVDPNQGTDIFLRDQRARTTVLVSHAASSPVTAATLSTFSLGPEDVVSMSADGRFLVYESWATDLVAGADDTNGAHDVFLYDRLTDASSLVSHASGAPLRAGNGRSEAPSLSADGSHVAFLSRATDLVPGPTPPLATLTSRNLYVKDRSTSNTAFIGQAFKLFGRPDPALSFAPRLSADGRRIAFSSDAALVPGDYNDTFDVYLWDQDGIVAVPPCKLLDTRRRSDRPILASDVQRTVAIRGACGVPATAKQAVVKVTVFNPSGKGNLRFYPGAVTGTLSGILRFERGVTRTESFTLPLSANGTVTILPFVAGKGTVHVAVEVNGYSE